MAAVADASSGSSARVSAQVRLPPRRALRAARRVLGSRRGRRWCCCSRGRWGLGAAARRRPLRLPGTLGGLAWGALKRTPRATPRGSPTARSGWRIASPRRSSGRAARSHAAGRCARGGRARAGRRARAARSSSAACIPRDGRFLPVPLVARRAAGAVAAAAAAVGTPARLLVRHRGRHRERAATRACWRIARGRTPRIAPQAAVVRGARLRRQDGGTGAAPSSGDLSAIFKDTALSSSVPTSTASSRRATSA